MIFLKTSNQQGALRGVQWIVCASEHGDDEDECLQVHQLIFVSASAY
jgi:hypothetical protein